MNCCFFHFHSFHLRDEFFTWTINMWQHVFGFVQIFRGNTHSRTRALHFTRLNAIYWEFTYTPAPVCQAENSYVIKSWYIIWTIECLWPISITGQRATSLLSAYSERKSKIQFNTICRCLFTDLYLAGKQPLVLWPDIRTTYVSHFDTYWNVLHVVEGEANKYYWIRKHEAMNASHMPFKHLFSTQETNEIEIRSERTCWANFGLVEPELSVEWQCLKWKTYIVCFTYLVQIVAGPNYV